MGAAAAIKFAANDYRVSAMVLDRSVPLSLSKHLADR